MAKSIIIEISVNACCFMFIRFPPRCHYKIFYALFSLLLLTLAFVNANIYSILLMDLLPLYNILVVIISKLLYKKSKAITIAILFQISWLGIKTTYNHLIRKQILVNQLIINFFNLFSLLIQE